MKALIRFKTYPYFEKKSHPAALPTQNRTRDIPTILAQTHGLPTYDPLLSTSNTHTEKPEDTYTHQHQEHILD